MRKNIERTKDGLDSLIDRTRDAVVGAADRAEHGVESTAKRMVRFQWSVASSTPASR